MIDFLYVLKIYVVIFFTLETVIKLTPAMKVYDEIDINKYCSDDTICSQTESGGPHIVCKYSETEPKTCKDFKAYDLSTSHVINIVNRINEARVARGEALGKNGLLLPKAYGLMRVFWDSELAAIAKLVTSMCIKAHLYNCAATAIFPNPVMAYLHQNITGEPAFTDPEQLIESLFQVWLDAQDNVSAAMIEECPTFKSGIARRHIKLLMDNLTHVGCAFGVYHVTRHTKAAHLTCYLSHWTPEGKPVYATKAPSPGSGYTEKCGCPPHHIETEDCLCVASPKIRLITSTSPYIIDEKHHTKNAFMAGVKLFDSFEYTPFRTVPSEAVTELRTERSPEWSDEAIEMAQTQKVSEVTPKHRSRVSKLPFFTIVPPCNNNSKIKPNIVMMPIFTLVDLTENSHGKKADFKDPTFYRSVNNKSWIMNDDMNALFLSDERFDEKYAVTLKNMSMKSQLRINKGKIKNQQETPITTTIITNKPLEPKAPIPKNKNTCSVSQNELKKIEKQKVMSLLDMLIEKGKNVDFNSREIVKFEAQMRRIYETALRKKDKSEPDNTNEH